MVTYNSAFRLACAERCESVVELTSKNQNLPRSPGLFLSLLSLSVPWLMRRWDCFLRCFPVPPSA